MFTVTRPIKIGALAFLIFLGFPFNSANAVVLTPDTITPLPGTTAAAEPNLAGTVIVDDLVDFSFAAYGGIVSGAVQVRIVESVDSTLDFYWRVFNDEDSAGAIRSFRLGNFFTSTYNANYRIDGLGDDAPDTAYLFSDPYDGYLNFNFDRGGLRSGSSSSFFFLDTDATQYARTAIYDLANLGHTQISGLFETYAPVNNVPAPTSIAMMGLGLLSLGFRKKCRKKILVNDN